eukprot:gene427-124_t
MVNKKQKQREQLCQRAETIGATVLRRELNIPHRLDEFCEVLGIDPPPQSSWDAITKFVMQKTLPKFLVKPPGGGVCTLLDEPDAVFEKSRETLVDEGLDNYWRTFVNLTRTPLDMVEYLMMTKSYFLNPDFLSSASATGSKNRHFDLVRLLTPYFSGVCRKSKDSFVEDCFAPEPDVGSQSPKKSKSNGAKKENKKGRKDFVDIGSRIEEVLESDPIEKITEVVEEMKQRIYPDAKKSSETKNSKSVSSKIDSKTDSKAAANTDENVPKNETLPQEKQKTTKDSLGERYASWDKFVGALSDDDVDESPKRAAKSAFQMDPNREVSNELMADYERELADQSHMEAPPLEHDFVSVKIDEGTLSSDDSPDSVDHEVKSKNKIKKASKEDKKENDQNQQNSGGSSEGVHVQKKAKRARKPKNRKKAEKLKAKVLENNSMEMNIGHELSAGSSGSDEPVPENCLRDEAGIVPPEGSNLESRKRDENVLEKEVYHRIPIVESSSNEGVRKKESSGEGDKVTSKKSEPEKTKQTKQKTALDAQYSKWDKLECSDDESDEERKKPKLDKDGGRTLTASEERLLKTTQEGISYAEKMLERGNEAFGEARYEKAAKFFVKGLSPIEALKHASESLGPGHRKIRNNLELMLANNACIATYKNEEYDLALEFANQVLDLDKNDCKARQKCLEIGTRLLQIDSHENARKAGKAFAAAGYNIHEKFDAMIDGLLFEWQGLENFTKYGLQKKNKTQHVLAEEDLDARDVSPHIAALREQLFPDVVDGSEIDGILNYHFRSKHFFDVQAEGPGTWMDPDRAPSPWKQFDGVESVVLDHNDNYAFQTSGSSLFSWDGGGRSDSIQFTLKEVSSFLRIGAGISAWKSYDGEHKWALRVSPTSGNLQTNEYYVVHGKNVYHYNAEYHVLEKRNEIDHSIGDSGFVVLLTTVCWREAWKYGERALRSCYLNTGHAISALAASARAHFWDIRLANFGSSEVLNITDGGEKFEMAIVVGDAELPENGFVSNATQCDINYCGGQNSHNGKSEMRRSWPLMYAVQESLIIQPDDMLASSQRPKSNSDVHFHSDATAAEIIFARRSALAFDKQISISTHQFLQIVASVAPSSPLLHLLGDRVHLVILVHSASGLKE